ncbi:DNA primase [Caldisericum exile]|uniref:DNA primase n=1 Tax=Caldisericum exile (strain DSM 21853 / NBRC 104410 / AZM16c01) TaxID=511051 RepID=A0A7U6JEZ4_CALEA|nr:DNA primase [Caldisericum exile]BAL80958.1 DNA primase [Caldisericum exile AZM16c01]
MRDLREIVEEIHSKIDIVDFIGKYVKLKKQGSNYVGLCPFHQEKTPSFVVSPTKQLYHCFGCGASGDIVTFLMKIENMSFKDALKQLGDIAGIEIPNNLPKENFDREILYAINEETKNYFVENLKGKPFEYLVKRGLSDQSIKTYQLGFIGEDNRGIYDYLLSKGFKREDILKTGNFRVDNSGNVVSYFYNRIMIPIFDLNGKIIGFSGRSFADQEPKYLNSIDSPIFKKGEVLYLMNFSKDYIREKKEAIIVEGYFDAIILFENGIKNVVSTMGTAFTEQHAKLIKRFASKVYFFFDNDIGGRNGAERAVEICNKFDLTSLIVIAENNLDPDEIILHEGTGAVMNLIKDAKDPVFFILDFELSKSDGTLQTKNSAIQKVIEALSKIDSKTLVYEYIKEISLKTKIEERFLIDAYNKIAGKNKSSNPSKDLVNLTSRIRNKIYQIQEVFTQAILQNSPLINEILKVCPIAEFDEPFRKIVTTALKDMEDGSVVNPPNWFELDQETYNKAVELYMRDEFLVREESIEEHIESYKDIKIYEAKLNALYNEIQNLEGEEKIEKMREFNILLKQYKGR